MNYRLFPPSKIIYQLLLNMFVLTFKQESDFYLLLEKKDRERQIYLSFSIHSPATARIGPNRSQKPGAPFRSLTWVAGQ